MNTILVTGAAGFIGMHVCLKLVEQGIRVVGLDNLNDYYSTDLKRLRLIQLQNAQTFTFKEMDLNDRAGMLGLFADFRFSHVIHLAAQAGVRYSLEDPDSYIKSNIEGTMSVLECCRAYPPEHLLYASSSSVYGLNQKIPFSTVDRTDHPASLYAATKKSNELTAYCYSQLFGLKITGLRFFSVYGPWGRPDMAYFLFAEKIMRNAPIELFNEGKNRRDFTYIDDVVDALLKLLKIPPKADQNGCHHVTYNISGGRAVETIEVLSLIEENLGRKAERRMLPPQPGEVELTWADTSDLAATLGQKNGLDERVSLEVGLRNFTKWYLDWKGLSVSNGTKNHLPSERRDQLLG